jgi:hypothetical protein
MHKFGLISLYLGLVLGAVGLIGGFGLMFAGSDAWAKPLIALVPVGFLAGVQRCSNDPSAQPR